MSVDAADLAHWRSWIGRTERRTEVLDPGALRRFAGAIGADLDVERRQPSLAHWAFFLPVTGDADLGPDGHTRRGGFQPPIALARRMFAAGAMTFVEPLALGQAASLTAEIVDVVHKAGRSGDLVFVEVDRRIEQNGALRVRERQTIVYREAGEKISPVRETHEAGGGAVWRPGPVELFRFSAATGNSHRIHYDAPYASEVEGYPGLVVHGPFTAAKLHAFAAQTRRDEGRADPIAQFSFQALAPSFAGQSIVLQSDEGAGVVAAIRCDGALIMRARAA